MVTNTVDAPGPGDGDFVLGPGYQIRQVWGETPIFMQVELADMRDADGRRVPFDQQMAAITADLALEAGTRAWREGDDGACSPLTTDGLTRGKVYLPFASARARGEFT